MDLKDYFATQSRIMGVELRTHSPAIKKMAPARRKAEAVGVMAIFDFDEFKINISYTEQGKHSYAQQTIWVSFSLESDRGIPYSLYDILAFTDSQNFNCYTYTYVDSEELMKKCFGELTELFKKTVPALKEQLSNGITKNRIISAQKDNINGYFGDDILDSGEMIGAAADKLISMMLQNFYESEIESAVVGSQALFYNGKHEKALKQLRKAKKKTLYQKNLLNYLEKGGTSENISSVAREASADKGIKRQSGGIKGVIKMLGYLFMIFVPVTLAVMLIFIIMCAVYFRGSSFVIGVADNLVLLPFFTFPLSMAFTWSFLIKKAEKSKKDGKNAVHLPSYSTTIKNFIKYFTIGAESVALLLCATSVLSCTAFYGDRFTYADSDFPSKQETCSYKSIESIYIIEGFEYEEKFTKEKYIAVKTKSGKTIDLYNSTWISHKDLLEHEEFFQEKNIEINTCRTIEEVKETP